MTTNPTQTLAPKDHASVLRAVTDQFADLFASSEQSMYVFLDDRSKACNARFASLLGYETPSQWAAVTASFPQAFVAPESQELLVETYQAAIHDGAAGRIPVTWKRKDGKGVRTNVILVPVDFAGHRVAVHFIEPATS